jgi:hypothetical protein
MAKHRVKNHRGSDAESVTSTASNSSRTAPTTAAAVPPSPRLKNGNFGQPKRKPSVASLNKVLFTQNEHCGLIDEATSSCDYRR